jgi:hypothetical protein
MLLKKYKEAIHTKLSFGYGKDALCQRTVDTWAVRLRSGRTSVEDNDKLGRSFCDDFSTEVSDDLEKNLHASCREIAKDLFVPKTTISRIL